MARARKKKYYDVFLTKAEIKKIESGKTVHRWQDEIGIAIKAVDGKVNKKIKKLEYNV